LPLLYIGHAQQKNLNLAPQNHSIRVGNVRPQGADWT